MLFPSSGSNLVCEGKRTLTFESRPISELTEMSASDIESILELMNSGILLGQDSRGMLSTTKSGINKHRVDGVADCIREREAGLNKADSTAAARAYLLSIAARMAQPYLSNPVDELSFSYYQPQPNADSGSTIANRTWHNDVSYKEDGTVIASPRERCIVVLGFDFTAKGVVVAERSDLGTRSLASTFTVRKSRVKEVGLLTKDANGQFDAESLFTRLNPNKYLLTSDGQVIVRAPLNVRFPSMDIVTTPELVMGRTSHVSLHCNPPSSPVFGRLAIVAGAPVAA